MVSFMSNPQVKVEVAGTEIDGVSNVKLTRLENGFDTAVVRVKDRIGVDGSRYYPSTIDAGKAVTIKVKDASDASWTTEFNGVIRFVHMPFSKAEEFAVLICDGAGYGFGETIVGQEYGADSANSTLDTIAEILTDSSYGIIPKYVNKILGSDTSSGYNYSSVVDAITGTIPYIYFPYKPCNKAIADLCDLVQAIKGTNAGPHWIVTTDSKFLLTTIANHSTDVANEGWTTYYNGSQANATLEQGKDFAEFDFQPSALEANYILYFGVLRKPAKDTWTEYASQQEVNDHWWSNDDVTLTRSNTVYLVGSYSLYFGKSVTDEGTFSYPKDRNAGWNFENIGSPTNPPSINFYVRITDVLPTNFYLRLETTGGTDYYQLDIKDDIPQLNTWYHLSYPIGPYYRNNLPADEVFEWASTGSPDWTNINCITFGVVGATDGWIDDLCLSGLICRVAKNSTSITNNKLKVKVVTDNVGKDDSMKANDDSGTIAQLAKAELLRCQKKVILGYIITPFLKNLLPGQLLHIHAKKDGSGTFNIDKDFRVTKLTHFIDSNGFRTMVFLTDDLTNAYPRMAYDDMNKVLSAVRPEYQDRQATSIKASQIDINVPRLEYDYG